MKGTCIISTSCLVEGTMPLLVTPHDSEKEDVDVITTTHCGTLQSQMLQMFSEEGDVLSLAGVDQAIQSIVIMNFTFQTSRIIHGFSITTKGSID